MEAIRRDPEVVQIIQDLFTKQEKEKRDLFANGEVHVSTINEKRVTGSKCLFYPTNIAGLKKFPEAAYLFVQRPSAFELMWSLPRPQYSGRSWLHQ